MRSPEIRPGIRRLFRLPGKRDPNRDADDEIRLHLELRTRELIASGMLPQDARAEAERRFGTVDEAHALFRHSNHRLDLSDRLRRSLESVRRDLRYAARTLSRSPVFTLSVVISLALGIGANTAIFGVIYALMLERLPVGQPEQLVELRRSNAAGDAGDEFWMSEYETLKSNPGVSLAAFTGAGARPVIVGGSEDRAPGDMLAVDGGFFQLVAVPLAAGRSISRADDAAGAPVVVLGYDLAARHFSSAAAALGGAVTLSHARFTVIGVTSPAFRGLGVGGSFAMAMPLHAAVNLLMTPQRLARGLEVTIVARASEHATAERAVDRAFQRCCANGELAPHAEGRVAAHDERVRLEDISRGIPAAKMDLRAEYARTLYLLMGGVAVLLLIACANVGNLLLARAAARARELAVRLSLGASRWRVVQQLLIESLALAIAGATLGLLLAVGGTRVLASHLPSALLRLEGVLTLRLQPQLFVFTTALSIACAAVFGLVPALRATRRDVILGLRGSALGVGKAPGRLDHTVVAVQISLALVLVTAAGLLAATLRNLRGGDGGFESAHMLIGDLEVRGTPYEQTGIRPLYAEMLRRVGALPGVRVAGMATRVPIAYGGWAPEKVTVPGYEPIPGEDMDVDFINLTPGYLAASGIPIRRGRDITTADRAGAPQVAIVSEAFVKRYLRARDPIGVRLRHDSDFGTGGEATVVGVAADAKYYDLRAPAQPTVYVPFEQVRDWGFLSLAVRTTPHPDALVPQVSAALNAAAPGVTVRWVQTMESMLDNRLARELTLAWLTTLFATLAVTIAATGLYGVQAYQVAARTSEIGIRMALGAERRRVVWLVLRRSLLVISTGASLGVPLAIIAGRAMESQLYGVAPWEAAALVRAIALLLAVGIPASVLPARRATRVDPLMAIRAE